MNSSQAQNCFDDILRMLRKHEQEEAATKDARDKTIEGLRYWKQHAQEAEEKLKLLGRDSSKRAALIRERDELNAKLQRVSAELQRMQDAFALAQRSLLHAPLGDGIPR